VFTGTTSCDPTLTGGTSQGFPANYNYVNGAANGTICAVNRTGTFYTVSGDWISSVGGWLVSNPVGINKTSKLATFQDPTASVTISVGDSANHQVQAGSWTGDCLGTAGPVCTLTLAQPKTAYTFGATVIAKPQGTGPIFNSSASTYHQTLAEATGAAASINVIKIANTYTQGGSTTGTPGVTVKLSGNWDESFTTQSGSKSMGALTITNVAVIADNLTL
jgi:hypothetical protein